MRNHKPNDAATEQDNLVFQAAQTLFSRGQYQAAVEEFMLKLMVHSERAFKLIGSFHKKIWYQVYFQEKINETMASQEQWRPEVEKKIKFESFA